MWLLIITMVLLPMKGITKQHFKNTRVKFELQGQVQIHHIIPRQFRNHPVLKEFDIEDGQNFLFMPTELGKQRLNTIRLTHDGVTVSTISLLVITSNTSIVTCLWIVEKTKY